MRKNNYIIYIILYNFTRESHIIRLIYTNFIINKVIVSKIKPQFSEGFTFRVCLLLSLCNEADEEKITKTRTMV